MSTLGQHPTKEPGFEEPTLLAGPGFELATMPVPEHLRRFVDSWLGYREVSEQARERVEYPTGRAVLIFEFGDPIAIGGPVGPNLSEPGPTHFRTGFFAGLDERATLTRFVGQQAGIEVNLSPAGAFALTRGGPHEVAGLVLETAELGLDAHLAERLREGSSWGERFRLVARELSNRTQNARALAALTQEALSRLDASRGALRIEALSRELGVSRKYLSQRFAAETGFAPKRYAALRRFAHVKHLLAEGRTSLAKIAHFTGYADQAHMAREVREFAGTTPSVLARRVTEPLAHEVHALLTGPDASYQDPA